ncbi:hypothetical protein GJ744_011810 [Endocarpon pusillum]|uniref:Uncharacterized protein n=1 Tax=Endocarpon pusillum TaxID=364733 RepID=A0A8H7AF80_9EURO|nr:hypothetical protein GJ744_011810 [Endocarpon pusillum]
MCAEQFQTLETYQGLHPRLNDIQPSLKVWTNDRPKRVQGAISAAFIERQYHLCETVPSTSTAV